MAVRLKISLWILMPPNLNLIFLISECDMMVPDNKILIYTVEHSTIDVLSPNAFTCQQSCEIDNECNSWIFQINTTNQCLHLQDALGNLTFD